MCKITYKELIDGLLAFSALKGDISGRGHLLVDNDEPALREVLKILVPGLLARTGIPYVEFSNGWRIGETRLSKLRITDYLLRELIGAIGNAGNMAAPTQLAGSNVPLLSGDF